MPLEQLVRRPIRSLPPTASCFEAAQLMRDECIGAVVVAQDGVPLGIVTDRDLAVRLVAEQLDATQVQLRDIMSRHPIFLSKERSLDDAITTMRDLGVRRLPIVDEHGILEGMLSMDDILMLMASQLGCLGEVVRAELTQPSEGKKRLTSDLDELRRLRDEIRAKVHLASVEAKSAWRELEPSLADLERRVEREGEEIAEATAKLGTDVKAAFRRFRDRIVGVHATGP